MVNFCLKNTKLNPNKKIMKNKKYRWSITSFCNDKGCGEAETIEQAIKDMRQVPLLPKDWIQTVVVHDDKGNAIIMAVRGNYDQRFCQHGVRAVPELDSLIDY